MLAIAALVVERSAPSAVGFVVVLGRDDSELPRIAVATPVAAEAIAGGELRSRLAVGALQVREHEPIVEATE